MIFLILYNIERLSESPMISFLVTGPCSQLRYYYNILTICWSKQLKQNKQNNNQQHYQERMKSSNAITQTFYPPRLVNFNENILLTNFIRYKHLMFVMCLLMFVKKDGPCLLLICVLHLCIPSVVFFLNYNWVTVKHTSYGTMLNLI